MFLLFDNMKYELVLLVLGSEGVITVYVNFYISIYTPVSEKSGVKLRPGYPTFLLFLMIQYLETVDDHKMTVVRSSMYFKSIYEYV